MISPTVKSKVSIGTKAAADDLSDFEADTYALIGGVEDLGEFGMSAAELTHTPVDGNPVRRRKGALDAGTLELIVARDSEDAGQTALRAAAADTDAIGYNFKVECADTFEAGGTPTFFYFKACVLAARSAFGSANNIVRTTFTLGIDGTIIEDPAAAAP